MIGPAAITDEIRTLPREQRVSPDSPLVKAYAKFVNSLRTCDRQKVLKHVSRASRAEMSELSALDFQVQCKLMKSLARSDFRGAKEVVEEDTATLVWEDSKEERDGDMTMTSSHTMTIAPVLDETPYLVIVTPITLSLHGFIQ